MSEVLIVGSGGREDALRQAMELSDAVTHVEVTTAPQEVLRHFSTHKKPLVIIGPEQPAVDGLADELRATGYPVLGASREAAKYESSKQFATHMMQQAGIPHPETVTFTDFHAAREYVLGSQPEDIVIKADGLAAGKGVVLPKSYLEAFTTVKNMMSGQAHGDSGRVVNVSARHHGPEVSAIAVVGDNDEFVLLPLTQDHKRLGEGDMGPNTGGMGAYGPVPESIVSPENYVAIHDIVADSLAGMREVDKVPFERAVLYVGIMLSGQQNGPTVIEYNVRFGDPETQVILPLLAESGVDVYSLLHSAAEGSLAKPDVCMNQLGKAALTVCLAAPGYPGAPVLGGEIYGLDHEHGNVTVQQAAVRDRKVAGGRVLYVTGVGDTIDAAADTVYDAIDVGRDGSNSGKIGFTDMQFRRDIGHQARPK